MRSIYIFDLDGTLALIDHRLHLIEGENKDWPRFFAACIHDKPNHPVLGILRALRAAGAEIWIWTGRSDEVRKETISQLIDFGVLDRNRFLNWLRSTPEALRMRKAGDHRPDHELKSEWLAEIEPPEYRRLAGAFEDRDRVVAMYREAGVPCFQVASGAF